MLSLAIWVSRRLTLAVLRYTTCYSNSIDWIRWWWYSEMSTGLKSWRLVQLSLTHGDCSSWSHFNDLPVHLVILCFCRQDAPSVYIRRIMLSLDPLCACGVVIRIPIMQQRFDKSHVLGIPYSRRFNQNLTPVVLVKPHHLQNDAPRTILRI